MRKLALGTLLILLLAGPLFVAGCKPARGRDASPQMLEQIPGFDPNAIVLLAYLGNHQHGAMLQWPRVAFAIGDGTLLLTAAHCVDDLCGSPGQAMSPDIVAISPYYGDAYSCEILVVDKEADVAVLKASWPVHPALALAGEEELKAAKRIVIVSRPSKKAKKPPYRLGRQIRAEKLPVLALDEKRPYKAIVLKGTRSVVEGWSGSAMVLPGSGKVAGVLGRLQPVRFRLLNIPLRKDAAGCGVRSIWTLLRKHRLESAAERHPAGLAPTKDAHRAFSLATDYFEALLNEDTAKPVEIARELATLRPRSVHARLFLAFGANLRAHTRQSKPKPFLALAESSYQEALRLEPNSAHAHAIYGNFLLNRGRNREALAQTESALAADPNNSLAVVNRLVILGVTDPAQAEEFGGQLVEKDPNNGRYWHYYGTALSKLGRYEQALAAARKAVALDPKGLYEGGLADALARMDRPDEAEPLYKKMTKACGCQRCWFRYARFLTNHRSDKLDEAQRALDMAASKAHMLRVSQEDLNLLRLRILEKTLPEDGETFARRLLKASPENGHYWWVLASILRTRGKHADAAEAAQKAVNFCPDYPYRPRLANTLAKAGRLEEAQKTYDAMLRDHPERGRYWFWYAKYLCEYFPDRMDEARRALEKAETASDRRWRVSDDDLRELREEIEANAKAPQEDAK